MASSTFPLQPDSPCVAAAPLPGGSAAPLPTAERLPLLDIVRGFALLGILVMNMPDFSTSFFAEADGSHLWPGALDRAVEQMCDVFFAGKFNSMFSLLFGIGFTIQFQRMQEADPVRAQALYLRRTFVLLVFGLVHACVFWTGDVLHTYAVLGFIALLLLRKVSDRTLFVLMGLALLYPAVSGVLRLALVTPDITAMLVRRSQAFEASNNAAYGHGSFWAALHEHTREFTHYYGDRWSLWSTLGWYVQMGLTMLLGLVAGRRRWPQRAAELMPKVRRLQWAALVVGLGCGVACSVIFELQPRPGPTVLKILGSVAYGLSRLATMVFYVLTLTRLTQDPAWVRRLLPLASAGRMPLTNYLLQTLVCTTVFYGWGFGLWGKVGPAAGLALAFVLFFGVQVPWSRWWLRRHDRGPMEQLWSRLTYGSRRWQARATGP